MPKKKTVAHSQPATKLLAGDFARVTTTKSGERLTQARNHRLKFGNARTVRSAEPVMSETSRAVGMPAVMVRKISVRFDSRVVDAAVTAGVYQHLFASRSSGELFFWKSRNQFWRRKNFLETGGGIGPDTPFKGSTYKTRHVNVTKFVFVTVKVNERVFTDSV